MPTDRERDCPRCGAATDVVDDCRSCVDDDCPWYLKISGSTGRSGGATL